MFSVKGIFQNFARLKTPLPESFFVKPQGLSSAALIQGDPFVFCQCSEICLCCKTSENGNKVMKKHIHTNIFTRKHR